MELLGWFFLVTIGIGGIALGFRVANPPRTNVYAYEQWWQGPVAWFLLCGGLIAVALNGLAMAELAIVQWR